jgi:hypothetical protein
LLPLLGSPADTARFTSAGRLLLTLLVTTTVVVEARDSVGVFVADVEPFETVGEDPIFERGIARFTSTFNTFH